MYAIRSYYAADHLAGAEVEAERVVAVEAGVELAAVREPPRVVDGDALAGGGRGTVALDQVLVFQPGIGNHRSH